MQKPDFETYQKRFQDVDTLPTFSETHLFLGTIRHPFYSLVFPYYLFVIMIL